MNISAFPVSRRPSFRLLVVSQTVSQEKLDFIRHGTSAMKETLKETWFGSGLIYHHGGVVLQWDVVFLRDMSSVAKQLSSYVAWTKQELPCCTEDLVSNPGGKLRL